MIDRYTRPEMGAVWTLENRFRKMLVVETTVAEVQADLGLIPNEAAKQIRAKGDFSIDRILEIEKTTRHDVIAFVSAVAEKVGPMGRYIHFGLTSSDVIDTAMSLLIRDAGQILSLSMARLEEVLRRRAEGSAEILCAGRTHGMHAEPTSFGMKLAGFWAEIVRNQERFNRAMEQMQIAKLSGAVGTYSTQTYEVEEGVCERLDLIRETVATQVIPRDRHAELMWSLAMIGGCLERLSVELRHLQRTEVGEAIEGFAAGQKGSSAMPHKKNPISAENIKGCARLLRSYSMAAMEDIALWHERDISHSAVERVIFPDAFILCDYALDRMAKLIEGLEIQEERMLENIDLSQGQLFSSHLLLALVDKGLSREDAYALVQKLSHRMKKGSHLREEAKSEAAVTKHLSNREIDSVFAGDRHREAIAGALSRAGVMKAKPAKETSKKTSAKAAGKSSAKSSSKKAAKPASTVKSSKKKSKK